MRLREVRIRLRRAAIQLDRLLDRGVALLVVQLPRPQVVLVGLGIARAAALDVRRLLLRQARAQCAHDVLRDLALGREYVLEPAVEALRPEVESVARRNELHGDPGAVRGAAHAAFQHRGHAERAADLTNIRGAFLELEGRGPRDDLQPAHAAERIDDLLGDPVAEITLVARRAHVRERQDRDRGMRRGRHRGADGHGLRRERGGRVLARRGPRDRRRRWRRFVAAGGSRLRTLDATRRDVEGPGQAAGERKAERREHDHELVRPGRQADRIEGRVRDLDQHPGDQDVDHRDAHHLAAAQLGEPAGGRGSRVVHPVLGIQPNDYKWRCWIPGVAGRWPVTHRLDAAQARLSATRGFPAANP